MEAMMEPLAKNLPRRRASTVEPADGIAGPIRRWGSSVVVLGIVYVASRSMRLLWLPRWLGRFIIALGVVILLGGILLRAFRRRQRTNKPRSKL